METTIAAAKVKHADLIRRLNQIYKIDTWNQTIDNAANMIYEAGITDSQERYVIMCASNYGKESPNIIKSSLSRL